MNDLLRASANDSVGSPADPAGSSVITAAGSKSSSEGSSYLNPPPALSRPILTSWAKDFGAHGWDFLVSCSWVLGDRDRGTLPAFRRPIFTISGRDDASSSITTSSSALSPISSEIGRGTLVSSASLQLLEGMEAARRSPSLTEDARSVAKISPPVASQGFSLEFSFSVCFLSDSAFLVDSQVEQSDDRIAGHNTRIFCVSPVLQNPSWVSMRGKVTAMVRSQECLPWGA